MSMDSHLLNTQLLKDMRILAIDSLMIEEVWHSLSLSSTEWQGMRELSIDFSKSVGTWIAFAAYHEKNCIGMMVLEFSLARNAHIHRLAVKKNYLHAQVEKRLLQTAENYCFAHGYSSLTVEIIDQPAAQQNYFDSFYQDTGFQLLFAKQSVHHTVNYLQKIFNLNDFQFIDMTHTLSADVPHWGLDVGFKYNARNIQNVESASNVKFRVQRLEMSSGIGTHMDAPAHCYENATAIADIPLSSLITACKVIDVAHKAHDTYSVSEEDILAFEMIYGAIPSNNFVIIYTGWDKRWTQPEKYRNEKIFPHLSIEAARLLLERNIVGLGIDTLSPDAFGSDFPVHRLMLGAGKYIIENVANADQLHPTESFVFALPIKIQDGTEAPMRLIGMKKKT